jgi:hypothetical protein
MSKHKLYVGTKIILGMPMDVVTFLEKFRGGCPVGQESKSGYLVEYPDGYVSWSPRETFENAYREVTDSERGLF